MIRREYQTDKLYAFLSTAMKLDLIRYWNIQQDTSMLDLTWYDERYVDATMELVIA
jgi:hypothetical protein